MQEKLVNERRLKKGKLGSGRTRVIDVGGERFIARCIEEKATAHGRRHDDKLYPQGCALSRENVWGFPQKEEGNGEQATLDSRYSARAQSVKSLLAFHFSDKDALQRIIKGEVFKIN